MSMILFQQKVGVTFPPLAGVYFNPRGKVSQIWVERVKKYVQHFPSGPRITCLPGNQCRVPDEHCFLYIRIFIYNYI